MKLYRSKSTGMLRGIGVHGATNLFATRAEVISDYKRVKRNSLNRERNQMLRDICGTSAAAAKRDMGL